MTAKQAQEMGYHWDASVSGGDALAMRQCWLHNEMLSVAMKKAVETGVLPKHVDEDTYLKNWSGMKHVLQAALDAAGL